MQTQHGDELLCVIPKTLSEPIILLCKQPSIRDFLFKKFACMLHFAVSKLDRGVYEGHLISGTDVIANCGAFSSIVEVLKDLAGSFEEAALPAVNLSYQAVSIGTVTAPELRNCATTLAETLVSRQAEVANYMGSIG
jgi:hypothetical protein